MAITTRKYNPGFLSDEEIIASFCVRTNELVSLVEMLRECTGNSNPHQLVIGPRGSGKTSLLRRVAAEIGRDDALSANFFPVVFAEESYEVSTAGEFWLECLSRLAVQAPRREGSPDLHRTYDELRTIGDDQTLENRCLTALLDFADRESKRLVLMVENLNMMFRDMVDQDAGWRLRKVLQTEPRIVLLASATSRFDQIDNPDQALYDQFRVRLLRPLDTQECAVLWKTVSGHDARSETIRSLEILTGGDPRLVVIVARFGAGRSFRNLMANLLDLVDDHTEYFRGHIELLPAQERRVYLALAELWKPATTKEIADRSRLKPSPCSAQLTRLVERGIVEVAGGTARRKQYYLTQRLYNIYYLLRRPRGPDRLVEALIRFMEAFYAPHELRDIGIGMAREAGNFDGEMRMLHQTALAQLLTLPSLAEHRDTLLTMIPPDLSEVLAQGLVSSGGPEPPWTGAESAPDQGNAVASAEMTARELIEKGKKFRKLKQPEDALATYDEVVSRYGTSKVPALREAVARALHRAGTLLWDLGRREDALAACDEVVGRYGTSEVPALQEAVARALVNRAVVLGELKRSEDALAACDEVVGRYGTSEMPALQEAVTRALLTRAGVLGELNRSEDVLAAYDEVVGRYGTSEMPALQEAVAGALHRAGTLLRDLGRHEDALAACDEVVGRYGTSEMPALQEAVARALVNRAVILGELNRSGDALAACDEVVGRYGTSKVLALQEAVTRALLTRAGVLGELKRSGDVLAACDEVVDRYGTSEVPALQEAVARALVNRAVVLGELKRSEDALAAYDEVVRRYGTSEVPALQEAVARALVTRAAILAELKRPEDALAAYDEVVHRYGTSDVPVFQEVVAMAFTNKGAALAELKRPEDALAVCDEAVRRYGTSDVPVFQEVVATAFTNKGAALAELKRPEDALAVCDEAVRRYGTSEVPALQEAVARALVNRAAVLRELKRPEDALAAYDEVVRRLSENAVPSGQRFIEHTLIEKASFELEHHRYEAAIKTADLALEQCRTESLENRVRGHLIRARATLVSDDPSGCEQDIEAFLALLPELDALPQEALAALMEFSIELGSARMHELIQGSPAAPLLLPLTTALEQELGLEPRVAREVDEVAQDIRKELKNLRSAKRRESLKTEEEEG